MYRTVLALVCACALLGAAPPLQNPAPGGSAWNAHQIAQLRRDLARILSAPALRGAQVGLLVQDTVRGTVLYSQNADQEFMPASNFKLLVGSASLQRLGTNFAFVTNVASDAPAQAGVVGGNLYLHGGGDAHLTAKDLDDAAAALAAQGIKRVDGALVTDPTRYDSQRYGYGWSWDDLPYYYAPVVTALELEEGTVHMTFSPGPSPGALAVLRVWPQSNAYTIDNQLVTGPAGSKDTSDIVRIWNKPDTIEITGSYPFGAKESGDVNPAVPDPQSYAGDVFARALAAHGITVAGGVHDGKMPGTATLLWSHDSEPMPKLLADFWYPSDNLMGELFLKELGVAQAGEPGNDEHGIALEQNFLRSLGINPDTVTISDGSGLSQYDRITPRDLVTILQADWNGPNRQVVLNALPVSGVRGTLEHAYVGTAAERAVFAKTGSISHVRTISGFVQTRTHGPITFSLLINQWMGGQQPGGPAALAKVRGDLFAHLALQ
ncbi:MAG TPA: D-alanyl-D-alanine carboxypeptidase/D-alanyl-D-alanine-endopeptidase [Candidatus Baltobacteraceae bacterium]|nr:D-alanyl-D-alanine carboxypeptidase/D-alanyl-D-alanine-endopeptidase [Candidatus Baltobacteraceae bacterium]